MAIDYSFQDRAHKQAMKVYNGELPCQMIVSPTGSGKTKMQSENLLALPGKILQVCPTLEIARGFCSWLGCGTSRQELEGGHVFTAKRLKNLLGDCELDLDNYVGIQIDEGHHAVDDTHMAIQAYLGRKPFQLFTATGYRGTAKGTAELHALVQGNIYHAIRIPEAIKLGIMAMPTIEVLPLVDDELIDVVGGEFQVTKIEGHTRNVLEEVARLVDTRYRRGDRWDRPTMIAVSSVQLAEDLHSLMSMSSVITGETPDAERIRIFQDLQDCKTVLIQIATVTEGVNLPELGRLIDLDPTMSPVKCMQRVGRVCRPKSPPPEWIVCNHNLLRHGYLWEGAIPPSTFIQAKTVWAKDFQPSKRLAIRAIRGDLKSLGRFQPSNVPTLDGTPAWFYCFGVVDGLVATQYGLLLHPAFPDPIMGKRTIPIGEDGKRDYTAKPRWVPIKGIPEIKGATSVPAGPFSPGQQKWWEQEAKHRNLDPAAKLDARTFQVLPFLNNLGRKVPQ